MVNTELLNSFLSMYWLRPENAVLSTVLADQLAGLSVNGVLLDMSCGDGLFMHTVLGGRLSEDFDIFQSTGNLELVRSRAVDIFDFVDDSYKVPVIIKPKRNIDYGFDIKPSMLYKAKSLEFYGALINGDVCKGVGIASSSIDTIYVNHTINTYVDLDCALSEIRRVMAENGRVYVSVYDVAISGFLENTYRKYPKTVAEIIDRGLLNSFCNHRLKYEEWVDVFEKARFHVDNVYPLVDKEFVPYWCIGLRPIAPVLIKLINAMRERNEEILLEVKNEWINLFKELSLPFINYAQTPEGAATYLFELSK
jgi:SAM-dependent methyltransferase